MATAGRDAATGNALGHVAQQGALARPGFAAEYEELGSDR
jgi:hypothetical protein